MRRFLALDTNGVGKTFRCPEQMEVHAVSVPDIDTILILVARVSVVLFPVVGCVAVLAAVRGILSQRVGWAKSRELSGRPAVVASAIMLFVGLIVLFLSWCFWFL